MLETYNEVLQEFKSDNLKRPGNSQFSQKELGILALDYVSELFNIKGVSTPEARAARKVLRERYQSLINQEFQRNNIHGSKVIWNQRVDNVLQGEDLTVETLSNLIATVTHPDSIFYNPQTQNKMGELDFLKYIIKRVGSNNEELINKLLNDVKPLRNGKPIGKNINSWIDLYKGDIDKHWSDFKTSSSIAEERRNKQEREEEGENQLNVILGSWNAVPGSDGYEGSGHYHMQQYLLGDEEGFIDWYNKKRINLIAYPEALEKFDSVMFKGGFDEAKGITKLERTKRLLEKGEVRRFLKSLNEETWPSTEKRELEALIPGAEYLLGIANVDTRFKQISKQLANKAGLVDLWTESGVDAIEGLRATTYRYQAEEIKLFLSFLGTDMTPENAWSQAQTAMKGIVNEGFDDSSSPYYWKQPEASKGTMPTEPGSYGNALPGPKDSNHNPDDVINWITNEIDPSSDTNKDNFIVTDIRTLIQNPSQLGKKSFFSTVDINEIAAQLKYGVKIHLTPYMKEVYNGVRHKVPEYTETQFLEDILIGAGYNVTPGNINQRDVFQANSEGKHKALIVNDKSLNSLKAFRIDAYRVALTVEGGQRLTINNKTAQEIDYDGVVKEKDWKWLENQGGFLNEEKFNFLLNNGIDIENDILFPPIDLGRIAEDSVTVYKDSAAFQQLNEKLEMYFPGNWKDLPIPKDSPVHFR